MRNNHRQPRLPIYMSYALGMVTALFFSRVSSPCSCTDGPGTALLINARNHARLSSDAKRQAIELRSHTDPYVISGNKEIQRLSQVGSGQICIEATRHMDLPYVWLVYKPTWNCVAKERLGELYDGGKWQCNVEVLAKTRDCVIYSLGSSAVVGYEHAVSSRTGCEIHVFDPTVSAMVVQPLLPPKATFHEIGIEGHTGKKEFNGKLRNVSTIQDIMTRLNHSRLQVLKMDIEGSEYDAIEALAQSGALSESIDELLVEFHWVGLSTTVRTIERILDAGFRIFSNEANLFFRPFPAGMIEYSFIHDRVVNNYNS